MKNFLDWSDDEVLAEVGPFGPGMVGRYLFERAEFLREVTGSGILGPGQRPEFVPSAAAMADLEARGMVQKAVLDFVPVESPVPPSDGPEGVEWVDVPATPTVQVIKRGPGRPRKVV